MVVASPSAGALLGLYASAAPGDSSAHTLIFSVLAVTRKSSGKVPPEPAFTSAPASASGRVRGSGHPETSRP